MLRFIYMFFVGLFLAVFVGTGIAVFYPSPKAPEAPAWFNMSGKIELTDAMRQEEQTFNNQQKTYFNDLSIYNRNVSIAALIIAVIILVIALVWAEFLGIVANGLLLGGIFTLIYGIGRGIATDNNQYRFLVAAIGLAVTLALGYVKFTGWQRHKAVKPA